MNKFYGICLSDCDIIGEIKDLKKLKITDLVQIVFKNEEENKYSIKLRDESDGPGHFKFNQTIYSCFSKNICIVENNLIPFLVDTDYFGRLDVLRFKKKILKLIAGSKGKLQVIYKNVTYLIECTVRHIGRDGLGVGYYAYVELTDFDFHTETLYKQLFNQYKNEHSLSWITIRVELLFTEIELFDLSNELEGFPSIVGDKIRSPISSISRPFNSQDNFGKSKMHIASDLLKPSILEGFHGDKTSYNRRNDNQEPMDIDHNNSVGTQNYYNKRRGSFTNSEIQRNNAMVVVDKLVDSKEWRTTCQMCRKPVDVFTFPCKHKFCNKCLLNQIDQIKLVLPAGCPTCHCGLEGHHLRNLSKFLNNLEENEQEKVPNYNLDQNSNGHSKNQMNVSNEYSKNDETKFVASDREMKKTLTGNPAEMPSCSCGTSHKNSTNNSCSVCKRPLTKFNDFKPKIKQ